MQRVTVGTCVSVWVVLFCDFVFVSSPANPVVGEGRGEKRRRERKKKGGIVFHSGLLSLCWVATWTRSAKSYLHKVERECNK